MILTYRYRIKDATTAKGLRAHARAVNYLWNYCGEIQEAARRQEKRWPSAFDLIKLTTRSSALLGLHSDTVQAICKQFVVNRNAARRRPHWRAKKSLGWIRFAAARAVKLDGDAVIYLKRRYRLWRSRPVDGKIKTGCFAQDARGRWYLSLQAEIAESQTCGAGEIGVDLGLSTLATLSDGRKIENPRHFKKYKGTLSKAQRARNKKRARVDGHAAGGQDALQGGARRFRLEVFAGAAGMELRRIAVDHAQHFGRVGGLRIELGEAVAGPRKCAALTRRDRERIGPRPAGGGSPRRGAPIRKSHRQSAARRQAVGQTAGASDPLRTENASRLSRSARATAPHASAEAVAGEKAAAGERPVARSAAQPGWRDTADGI